MGFGAGLGLGVLAGVALGLGVARGVDVRVGAERGGGGTEVGAGVGGADVAAGAVMDGVDALSVVVDAGAGAAGEAGATATRATVSAGWLQAVTPTARHAAPSAAAANRPRGSDMRAETTPTGLHGPRVRHGVVGCTSPRRRS